MAAFGEFEFRGGNPQSAREHFAAALVLARNPMEKRFLERRIAACARVAARRKAQYSAPSH